MRHVCLNCICILYVVGCEQAGGPELCDQNIEFTILPPIISVFKCVDLLQSAAGEQQLVSLDELLPLQLIYCLLLPK